jgi:hypoxanthine-DNA glycosylase
MNPVRYSFPPIVDDQTELLILGSMPGETSLLHQHYYAHPRNRFWKVMEYVIGQALPSSNEERINMLLKNRIGLWNVLHSAERQGSLDSAIRNAKPNQVPEFLAAHRTIKTIAFNGLQVQTLFKKYNTLDPSMRYIPLPATSPANARISLEMLKQTWKLELGLNS